MCDGTAVSRTTYKDLFSIIGTNFGVGDGSTTFNIPDLRGEFLRGAGTNSHSGQGNGSNVGVHQDATEIASSFSWAENNSIYAGAYVPASNYPYNPDKTRNTDTSTSEYRMRASASREPSPYGANFYTVRPTNTSVNYIIKMFKTGTPVDFDGQDVYATTERRVGTWIDGKPLYRRVITANTGSVNADNTVLDMSSWNIDKVVNYNGMLHEATNSFTHYMPIGTYLVGWWIVSNVLKERHTQTAWDNKPFWVIIEYTKTTD